MDGGSGVWWVAGGDLIASTRCATRLGVSWGTPPPRNSKSEGKGLIKMLGTSIIAILLKTFP